MEAVEEELRAAGGDSGGDDREPEIEEGAFYIQFGSSRLAWHPVFVFFFSFKLRKSCFRFFFLIRKS